MFIVTKLNPAKSDESFAVQIDTHLVVSHEQLCRISSPIQDLKGLKFEMCTSSLQVTWVEMANSLKWV